MSNLERVFKVLCKQLSSIMNAGWPCPSSIIEEETGLTKNQVYYALCKLRDMGLVEKATLHASPEDECQLPYYCWDITSEGRNSKEFLEESLKDCINMIDYDSFWSPWQHDREEIEEKLKTARSVFG